MPEPSNTLGSPWIRLLRCCDLLSSVPGVIEGPGNYVRVATWLKYVWAHIHPCPSRIAEAIQSAFLACSTAFRTVGWVERSGGGMWEVVRSNEGTVALEDA